MKKTTKKELKTSFFLKLKQLLYIILKIHSKKTIQEKKETNNDTNNQRTSN